MSSDAEFVRAPGLDALLDLLAGQILLKGFLGQCDNFVIGGKAEADQLTFKRAYRSARAIRREPVPGGGDVLQDG